MSRFKISFNKLDPREIAVLKRQFDASPFAQRLTDTNQRPTLVNIFDFDSTLFLTPNLSTTLWHPSLINALSAECRVGPGWWRDLCSLELGPLDQLEKTAWEGYWNESIVRLVRESQRDRNALTVLLTGRRYHPFHRIIPKMLESKGLAFDIIGLRPDPEVVSASVDMDAPQPYNTEKSVFASTMAFKTAFILHLLHRLPSAHTVRMWDDRKYHVERFRRLLTDITKSNLIKRSVVNHVRSIDPEYNPTWERSVVDRILKAHNDLMQRRIAQGKSQPGDQSYVLCSQPVATAVILSDASVREIHRLFAPMHRAPSSTSSVAPSYKRNRGHLTFFGDKVIVDGTSLSESVGLFGGLKAKVDVKLVSKSAMGVNGSLYLQVLIKRQQDPLYGKQRFVLPVLYRPTEFTSILWKPSRVTQWDELPADQQRQMTGFIDNVHLTNIHHSPLQ